MGFFSWFQRAFASARALTSRTPVVAAKPLFEQFQRIGGNIGPREVGWIMSAADAGQPARMVDLFNESRQKDGHLQCVCGVREGAVSSVEQSIMPPEDAKRKDKLAAELCRRAVAEFADWQTFLETLAGSFITGHATCEITWEKTSDGWILPKSHKLVPQRHFIFTQDTGELRYARFIGDIIGSDILAENPGRIVQIQRRINGDVQIREGLIRLLIWMALLRNWGTKDWVALGEVGWKPWRYVVYKKSAVTDQDKQEGADWIESIGSTGTGILPDSLEPHIEWPKGTVVPTGTGNHQSLIDHLGREMSKAVLGQTTTTEPGPSGDRASTQIRDKVRKEIQDRDCKAVAAVIRDQLFAYIVAINVGDGARVPAYWFNTDDSTNLLEFSEGVKNLASAGVRLPAKWVRDEVGAPEPKDGEEIVGNKQPETAVDPANDQSAAAA